MSLTCPHHGPCPGCPQLGLSEREQAELKASLVRSAVHAYPRLKRADIAATDTTTARFGYRTRAKWRVGRGGHIGLYRAGTHSVEDLPQCGVVRPVLLQAAQALRALMAVDAPPWLRSVEDGGALTALDLREVLATDEPQVLAMLVLDRDVPTRELELFAPRWRSACPAIVSVAAHRRLQSHTVLGGDTQLLVGPAEVPDRILRDAPPFSATHGAFVQAHRGVAATLLQRIRAGMPRGRVLELFAGSGALALALARAGHTVVAVESFGPAMDRLRRAANDAGLEGSIEAIAHDATSVALDLRARGERFDAVVVNPPRTGLRPELRAALASVAPAKIFYVSCEPTTLARDLSDLRVRGYAAPQLWPFDMMPQTAQVETLAVLERIEPAALTILFEDETLIAVDKPPHLPTTPQGEHDGSVLALLRAQLALPRATPVHRLDEGTSGVCLFARTEADVAPLQAALKEATKKYLALVRGVPHQKGKIARPLKDGGRELPATSRYTRLSIAGGHALIEVRPDEGRTHQIRRHLASIERPILGDTRYGHGPSNVHFYERFGLDRPFLHVHRIELTRPSGVVRIDCPLAPDLDQVLNALRASR